MSELNETLGEQTCVHTSTQTRVQGSSYRPHTEPESGCTDPKWWKAQQLTNAHWREFQQHTQHTTLRRWCFLVKWTQFHVNDIFRERLRVWISFKHITAMLGFICNVALWAEHSADLNAAEMSLYIRNLKSLTNEAHRNTEKTLVPLYIKHYLIGNKALIMLNFY